MMFLKLKLFAFFFKKILYLLEYWSSPRSKEPRQEGLPRMSQEWGGWWLVQREDGERGRCMER